MLIFIPATLLNETIAGTFELDIYAVENVNQLNDIKPRTLLVGKTYFNFDYAAFSPNQNRLQPGSNNRFPYQIYPPYSSIV